MHLLIASLRLGGRRSPVTGGDVTVTNC